MIFKSIRKMIRRGNIEESAGSDGTLIDWGKLKKAPRILCDGCGLIRRCVDKYSSPNGWSGSFYSVLHFCSNCTTLQLTVIPIPKLT